jgi:hypothetical protein
MRVSAQNRPPIEAHYPSTFRERGVAVPFTAPMLAGARLRDSGRDGIELVVPNPSGGPGVYIQHWSTAREAYRPTLHDSVLLHRLAGPVALHPRMVRAAAWNVARKGLAGHDARTAAHDAAVSDRSERRTAVFLLLRRVLEQAEPRSMGLKPVLGRSAAFDHQVSEGLRRLAPRFGRTGPQLRDTLAALGGVFAPIGAAPDGTSSLVARLIDQLQQTRDQMAGAVLLGRENDSVGLGQSVTDSMDTALACARASFRAARALLTDPLTLLNHWIATPEKVEALVTRTEWILDGWEQISLLWQLAPDNPARRGVLPEMAQLVPILPSEVIEWTDAMVPADALEPACRVTCLNDSWRRGGGAFNQIARNERLRAMSQ